MAADRPKVNSRTSYFPLPARRVRAIGCAPMRDYEPCATTVDGRRRDDHARPARHAQRALRRAARRPDRRVRGGARRRRRALRRAHLLAREGVLARAATWRLRGRRAARAQALRRPSASRACSALIGELGKPTLCAANGHVLAGALGLALACDLIVAREGARFGTPEINVGVFPFMIMALIYRNVAAQEDQRAAAAGRADLRRGGRADRDRQPGRAGRGVRRRRGRLGRRSWRPSRRC